VREQWADLVRNGVQRRVLRILGDDGETARVAMQLREARLSRRFHEVPRITAPGRALEWGAGLERFCDAWRALGGDAASATTGADPQRGSPLWVVAAALGPDATGGTAKRTAIEAVRLGAQRLVLDMPRQQPAGPVKAALEKSGWRVVVEDLLATELGELVTRRRTLVLAATGVDPGQELWTLAGLDLRRPIAPACGPVLEQLGDIPPDDWVSGARFEADPRMRRPEDKNLPIGVGHLWAGQGRGSSTVRAGPYPHSR
jgi:hypothetical protein